MVMMLLVILTMLGLMATRSTDFELKTAGSDKVYRTTFEAANTGLSMAIADPDVLGGINTSDTAIMRLTVQGDQMIKQTIDKASGNVVSSSTTTLAATADSNQSPPFVTDVEYLGARTGASLRGAGYSAGKFRAHNYQISARAVGVTGAQSRVEAEGFRVGF